MAERRAVGLGSNTGTGTFGRGHARSSVGRGEIYKGDHLTETRSKGEIVLRRPKGAHRCCVLTGDVYVQLWPRHSMDPVSFFMFCWVVATSCVFDSSYVLNGTQ